MLMREPEPPTVRAASTIRERFADIPALLRADRGFFWVNVVTILAQGARMSAPFTILYAGQIVPMNGVTLGLFTLVFLGADTVSNLIWGYAGDRWGFRAVTIGSLLTWIAGIALLLAAQDLELLLAAFALIGASQAGAFMAQTQVLEFGARDDTAMRLAVTATSEGAMATVGPFVGGAIAALFGYPALFCVALAFLIAALSVTLRYVPETRGRTG
jgi:MFS family permease